MARTALEGITVISLGTGVVVPDAGKILGELGANVIKIESSDNLDFVRTLAADKNASAGFNESNRNKRSFGVNLKLDKGQEIVKQLIKISDVVAENFRGGVVKSLGLDYKSVQPLKPDIIYISSQGFGGGGPHSDYPAYGPMLSSASGMLSIWKQPDDPYPVGSNSPLPDHMASKQVAIAILAALDYRRRTGKGQFIDLAQTEVAAALIGEHYLDYTMNKREPQSQGNYCSYAAPHGCYPCQGQDNWVAISVFTNEEWRSFGEAIGNPAWAKDPKFADITGRLKNVDELDRLVVEWTSDREANEVMEMLQSAGVAAGVVQRAPDTLEDSQLKHLNAIVELEHPAVGKRIYNDIPFHLSETPPLPSSPAPLLGQHTDEICRELLKMSTEEVEKLKAGGILESP
jgi:crotonobetainyl-CoA:carnitine CoA-transferase CaiB-like acyl-CoA transferase